MTETGNDSRIDQIMNLIISLAGGDLDARGSISNKGDELDAILMGLNMLAEELNMTTTNLITAQNNLNNILQSMLDTLVVLDPDFNIITVNQAILALLGLLIPALFSSLFPHSFLQKIA